MSAYTITKYKVIEIIFYHLEALNRDPNNELTWYF